MFAIYSMPLPVLPHFSPPSPRTSPSPITHCPALYNLSIPPQLLANHSFTAGRPNPTKSTKKQNFLPKFKMKSSFSVLALTALISLATAQSMPACAQPCINAAVASATTCGASDIACQCTPSNEAAIQNAATSCVLSSCSPADVTSKSRHHKIP